MKMKNIFLRALAVACLLSVSVCAFAQEKTLQDLAGRISESFVEFDFSYSMIKADSPEITGTGRMEMQGDDYAMTQGSMEIRCFGGTKWTIDDSSQEVVIESVSETSGFDITANPSVLLASFDEIFECISSSAASFEGQRCISYSLVPSADDTGIKDMILYLSSAGDAVLGMSLQMDDDTSARFVLRNFRLSAKVDAGRFAAPVEFGKDYIITDLRS